MRRTDELGAHVWGMFAGGLKGGERMAQAAIGFVVERDQEFEGIVSEDAAAIEVEVVDAQAVVDDGGERGAAVGVVERGQRDEPHARGELPEGGGLVGDV